MRDNRFRLPPGVTLAAQGITSGPLYDKLASSLLAWTGHHVRLRKLVSRRSLPRDVTSAGDDPWVVNGLIDRVADAGRCDVVTDIARPIPRRSSARCSVRPARTGSCSPTGPKIFKAFNFQPDVTFDESAIMSAWSELDAYVDDMVAARRDDLTDDLLSELIRAESDGDRLNLDELRMLVAGFLMAGTDTTATNWRRRCRCSASIPINGRSCATILNWRCRRSRRACATRPPPPIVPRAAIEDVEFGGYLFPAGTFVFANTFAANRINDLRRC